MWYSQDTETVYMGDKASWQDIELTTERPSFYHYPEIENGLHTGEWVLDEAKQRQASIPESVSNRQGMLALIEFDYVNAVETAIASISDEKERRKAEAEYKAARWDFDSQFLRDMWQSLGGTETQLENLFIYASQQ